MSTYAASSQKKKKKKRERERRELRTLGQQNKSTGLGLKASDPKVWF